eukprot:TRINITY_DN498_c0_g1_i15.p1 TRINITY_DN498_c0_g1~~TRINITY_DN498_c0_g1_i15.p1  ORF type:complete len:306 (-),score=93.34 TRINITY_DN498_c0_g1_i15:169-1086(-)
MQQLQDRLRPRNKHRTRKPRPIYVPKKSTTASEGSIAENEVKEIGEESFDADRQLSSITDAYERLQTDYDEADDKFKSSVFFKSKVEREKDQSEKVLRGKMEAYEKILASVSERKELVEDMRRRIATCENDNERIEKENVDLLQTILEKDKEIQKAQESQTIFKTSNKGVNTINGGILGRLSEGDQRMQEIYEEYEAKLKEAEQELKAVETSLETAKAKELELLAKKAEMEKEVQEFKSLLQYFNEPATNDKSIPEITETLINLKKLKGNLEANIKESKANTYIYKVVTMFFVWFGVRSRCWCWR